ncbi:hypothetical protein AB4Y63_06715 [Leifsonia sp. YAF41]|uniref:hypothetical protein n=1 Tax=Leifsonia sp. YAF41 TaxID=3233086 RepID=UPI003F9C802E
MERAGEQRTSVVRMFPDYANTVLWFVVGPVRYSESALSPTLVRELEEWEQSYYDGLTPDYEWRSPERGEQVSAEGERLAQLVADELGSEFEIDFADRRFRSTSAADNPNAATAFRDLAAHFRAERERIDRQSKDAASGSGVAGWYAKIRGGGRVFLPVHGDASQQEPEKPAQ